MCFVIASLIILSIGMLLGYRPETGFIGVFAALALLIAIGFGMGLWM